MEIVGDDIGYAYTKTDTGYIIPSKISTHESILGESIKVTLNNKSYVVGEGEGNYELNKIDSDLTKVLIYTSLAQSYPNEEHFKVVTGLPIEQFQTEQYTQLKNLMLSNNSKFSINGKERRIIILDAEIYPQGAAPLYANNIQGDAILIDLGSRTVNIALFSIVNGKRKLVKYSTLYVGLLTLYTSIIENINKQFTLSLEIEDAQKILKEGLYIFSQKQDLSFLKPILVNYTEPIFSTLFLKYPYKTVKSYLHGGGAYLLGEIFKSKFPNLEVLPDSQFCNAKGFKRIGEYKWLTKT